MNNCSKNIFCSMLGLSLIVTGNINAMDWPTSDLYGVMKTYPPSSEYDRFVGTYLFEMRKDRELFNSMSIKPARSTAPLARECIILPEFRTVTPQAMLHYCAIKKIRQVFEGAVDTEFLKEYAKKVGVVGSYHHEKLPNLATLTTTKQGLILHFMNDIPEELSTPWGKVELVDLIVNTGDDVNVFWTRVKDVLLSSMTSAVFAQHSENNSWIDYKLLCVDKKNLPEPILLNEFPYDWEKKQNNDIIRKVWADMEVEYQRTTAQ